MTESTETIEDEEHRASGRLVACERKLSDINPEKYHHDCFLVSKAMTRLLRHDQSVPWEDDGQSYFTTSWKNSRRKGSMVLVFFRYWMERGALSAT